ncbi:DUF1990 domain-containing protein [Streptomyces sp. V4-01]|uniref:DUF1990 domain-containing protein n=1 Tax=Actinacidiphila polyblastidii TaxID=3110430 RepID=A0ABU7PDR2_9ACTN|nr:DUF1990 domain-containing protein [Streptomyces sp. V4-01]
MQDLTYSTPGMTAGDEPAPLGFRVLRVRTALGAGTFDRAAEALFRWRMHRGTPLLRLSATAEEAAPGVRVSLRLGPVRAPCEVVWAVRESNRAGFGYGTLPGHPECGEEAFILERRPDGSVDFTVLAVSRPSAWYLKAAGPCGRAAQRVVAGRYGATLRRLARS